MRSNDQSAIAKTANKTTRSGESGYIKVRHGVAIAGAGRVNKNDPMISSRQISLGTLLSWVTACAVFIASVRWAVTSTMLGSPIDTFLYVFGFPLLYFGIVVAPFICLGCLLAIVGFSIRHLQTSISSLMFVGYGCLALSVSVYSPWTSGWQSGSRILALMALSSCACIAETYYRDLPDWHRWVAGITVLATLAFYLHLSAIVLCISA